MVISLTAWSQSVFIIITHGCYDNICMQKFYENIILSAPIMVFSKDTSGRFGSFLESNKPLFINPYVMRESFEEVLIPSAINGSEKYKWEDKIDKVFLERGSHSIKSVLSEWQR